MRVVGTLHTLRVGARVVSVEIAPRADGKILVALPGLRPIAVELEDAQAAASRAVRGPGAHAGPRTVRAVMPGIVRAVMVEQGKRVAQNDALLVLEAMKMQNEIRSEHDGVVARVHVRPGQSIASGEPLLELAPPAS